MSDLTRAVIDALLPPGSAWRVKPGGHLDHLLQGIADNHAATLVDLRALGEARDPRTTPYLEELERDYGIDPNPQIPEAQRRAALATVMFSRDKLGTADDLQAELDASGFGTGGLGLHVYPNDPAVDPGLFAEGGAQSWCGKAESCCGYTIAGIANEDWAAIAWNGSAYCAVGIDACATSPDGTTWTAQAGLGAGDWKAIAWNGSVFCAVGLGDICATSPTGVTWTPRTISAGDWRGIAWDGTQFCAVGSGGTNYAATSPTGTTWTPQAGLASGVWQGIAWAAGPNLFVAVGDASPSGGGVGKAIATSPTGVTWTLRHTLSNRNWSAVTYSPTLGLWCAVCRQRWSDYKNVSTSPDAVTWTDRAVPSWATAWRAVAWNTVAELFVAVGDGPSSYCATSPDGLVWTLRPSMPPRVWTALVWSGTEMMAVGEDGACASTDGILWEEQLGGVLAFCGAQEGGVYVVNGDVVTQAPAYLGCGHAEMCCGFEPTGGGDSTAVCGRYVTLIYSPVVIASPGTPGTWPLVFFVAGGATLDADGYITDIVRADVPSNLRNLLVELVMRWKPTHSWALLYADFT